MSVRFKRRCYQAAAGAGFWDCKDAGPNIIETALWSRCQQLGAAKRWGGPAQLVRQEASYHCVLLASSCTCAGWA